MSVTTYSTVQTEVIYTLDYTSYWDHLLKSLFWIKFYCIYLQDLINRIHVLQIAQDNNVHVQ